MPPVGRGERRGERSPRLGGGMNTGERVQGGERWEKVRVSQRNRKDPRGAVRGSKCGTRSKVTGLLVW